MASVEGARVIGWEPAPTPGWVAPHLEAEFPGLSLASVEIDGRVRRSPDPVRRRLRDLSDRLRGAEAIRLRGRPIPWAYRVFYRQIGLDPDHDRTPIEQLVLDRLQDGGFRPRGLPTDALTIATIETGVALRAFDADQLVGGLCIRDAAPGESLPGRADALAAEQLVESSGRHSVYSTGGCERESFSYCCRHRSPWPPAAAAAPHTPSASSRPRTPTATSCASSAARTSR